MPVGFDQASAGGDHRAGVGNVLKHLHAGDHIELPGVFSGEILGGALLVIDIQSGFQQVQPGNLQRCRTHIDAGYRGALGGHRFGEDAAAATDIDHAPALDAPTQAVDVIEPQRVDVVQWLEFAVCIPPA